MHKNDIMAHGTELHDDRWHAARATSYLSHDHPFWEIVLYTHGTGVATVDTREIAFRPGTIICNPPRTAHSERSPGGFQNVWVAIRELQTSVDIPVIHLYTDHPIFSIVPIMRDEQRLKRPASELILRNLFNTFMIYLNEHLAHDTHEQVVAQLARTITSNLENPSFELRAVYGELAMSADHVRRLFVQRMGCSPVHYLIQLRMERAKELLRMGFSVKETAYRVGLPDQYYFSRLFSRTQKQSPSEYRQNPPEPEQQVWTPDMIRPASIAASRGEGTID